MRDFESSMEANFNLGRTGVRETPKKELATEDKSSTSRWDVEDATLVVSA